MEAAVTLRFHTIWLAIGIALIAGVVWSSLSPELPVSGFQFPHADKLNHLLAYFVLMAWFAQIYMQRGNRQWLVIGFILLGVILEYLQGLNPSRLFEVTDMAANALGVMLGWLVTRGSMGRLLYRFERRVFGR